MATPRSRMISISVCICTRNRPSALAQALASIAAGSSPPHEVIVSDDSTDDKTRRLVAAEFPGIIHVEGPRRGLGANRNTALRHATGTHILFIDDDVLLGHDFLGQAEAELAQAPLATILSGIELNHGTPVHPHKVTFLGYQAVDYRENEPYETVVINATLFPTALFSRTLFDENLVYGCEEMDFASRAVLLHGHHIVFRPALVNLHLPSAGNRDFYAPFIEASRIYVTFKRYYWVECNPAKAMLFLLIAYPHILAHDVRRRGISGLSVFVSTFSRSLSYMRLCRQDTQRYF
jgi:glycosyltransferase involved in cell wall biosynthesis